MLLSLRMAKELENKRTVQKINTHKSVLQDLYISLEAEIEEFKRHVATVNDDLVMLLANILSSLDQLRQEDKKLQNEICYISKRIRKVRIWSSNGKCRRKVAVRSSKSKFSRKDTKIVWTA